MKDEFTWIKQFDYTIWYNPQELPSEDQIHGIKKYPGRFPPFIPKELIKKYTEIGDLILDPFVGSGTTLIEAIKQDRMSIGIDINEDAVKICNEKISLLNNRRDKITRAYVGDARRLFLKDETVDLIITSPPYWNMLEYSNKMDCLANQNNFNDYLCGIEKAIIEMYRVLKPNKYCCFVISDYNEGWKFHPLGYHMQHLLIKNKFILQRIIIHIQCRTKSIIMSNNRVKDRVLDKGLFLIAHEYIIIAKKISE